MSRTARDVGPLLILLAFACSGAPDPAADRARFDEAVRSFYAAVDSGDVAARLALFADDAMMLPDHWPTIRGIEALRRVIDDTTSARFRIRGREVLHSAVSGDIGYTVNQYEWTMLEPGRETEWRATKNVHIWRRQPDGNWKLQLDAWMADPRRTAARDSS